MVRLRSGQSDLLAQSAHSADLMISTSGTVYFNAPVTLVVTSSSNADSSISTIDNAGSGNVVFQQPVTWSAAYNSADASFPLTESTALVWNAAGGSITFAAGASLTHGLTTANLGQVTVQVGIQNNGPGRLTFNGPVTVTPRIEASAGATQQFSVMAVNNAGGILDISGTLR